VGFRHLLLLGHLVWRVVDIAPYELPRRTYYYYSVAAAASWDLRIHCRRKRGQEILVAQAQEINSNQGSWLTQCDLSSSEGPPSLQQRHPDDSGKGARGLGPGPRDRVPWGARTFFGRPSSLVGGLSMARSRRARPWAGAGGGAASQLAWQMSHRADDHSLIIRSCPVICNGRTNPNTALVVQHCM
jgi:hypothetical protein